MARDSAGQPAPQPFRVAIPDDVLLDLRRRLDGTRWPDELPGSGWHHGTDLAYARDLVTYWRDEYDWRRQEARLNAFPQYTVSLHGIDLHYIHQPAADPDAVPVLLLHGWPSSVWEFSQLIPLLSDPPAGVSPLDVVAVSLPGYGFSFRPFQRRFGINDCAELITTLMTDVLGYRRFIVAGGDWGAYVAARMAYTHPDAVGGLHLNMLPLRRDPHWPADPTPEEAAYLRALQEWQHEEAGYSSIQATRPQTLAYALTDSPAGLATWIVEKFARWSDHGARPEPPFSRDDLLTTVMLYWVTGAIGSSFWPYHTRHHGEWTVNDLLPQRQRLRTPTCYLEFPYENIRPPRSLAERFFPIHRWTTAASGGHFPAWEQPQLLSRSITQFATEIRGGLHD